MKFNFSAEQFNEYRFRFELNGSYIEINGNKIITKICLETQKGRDSKHVFNKMYNSLASFCLSVILNMSQDDSNDLVERIQREKKVEVKPFVIEYNDKLRLRTYLMRVKGGSLSNMTVRNYKLVITDERFPPKEDQPEQSPQKEIKVDPDYHISSHSLEEAIGRGLKLEYASESVFRGIVRCTDQLEEIGVLGTYIVDGDMKILKSLVIVFYYTIRSKAWNIFLELGLRHQDEEVYDLVSSILSAVFRVSQEDAKELSGYIGSRKAGHFDVYYSVFVDRKKPTINPLYKKERICSRFIIEDLTYLPEEEP
jgi:hypothetical protein